MYLYDLTPKGYIFDVYSNHLLKDKHLLFDHLLKFDWL